MSPEETKALLDNVITEVGGAADLVGIIDPALLPLIVIGKAVSKVIPGLAADVQKWIEGNPPTEAEKADTAAKIAVLQDPNNP